jgi:ribosome-binding factor A
MKQIFDTDSILFGILNSSPVKNAISGGIYVGSDRPDDSNEEDIVVNSVDLTQDYHPQIGTSNVNVFVKDMSVQIDGKQQVKANRVRLKALSNRVLEALRAAKVPGLIFTIDNQAILAEPSAKQHYVNLRISWNIQTN